MGYDEQTVEHVRRALAGRCGRVADGGGRLFLVGGGLCCGVTGSALMARGPEGTRGDPRRARRRWPSRTCARWCWAGMHWAASCASSRRDTRARPRWRGGFSAASTRWHRCLRRRLPRAKCGRSSDKWTGEAKAYRTGARKPLGFSQGRNGLLPLACIAHMYWSMGRQDGKTRWADALPAHTTYWVPRASRCEHLALLVTGRVPPE